MRLFDWLYDRAGTALVILLCLMVARAYMRHTRQFRADCARQEKLLQERLASWPMPPGLEWLEKCPTCVALGTHAYALGDSSYATWPDDKPKKRCRVKIKDWFWNFAGLPRCAVCDQPLWASQIVCSGVCLSKYLIEYARRKRKGNEQKSD